MDFDPDRFRLGANSKVVPRRLERPPRHARGERFLKGPVPLLWLSTAARLPGRALHVAVYLWFLAGLKNSGTFRLSLSRLGGFGLDRFAARRGLDVLEQANLVSVVRRQGRVAIITILEAPSQTSTGYNTEDDQR